ncbi:vacuolar protein sorting 33A-like protein [Apodospora peruviana]|uniref:Vacuolar protein sorting 33A-like protein n=1 Tax=Apodospora peruviana TaxID=516989 RepID=A0AAE0IQX0_9PEZI|nr:vacuolar protein sorting 33A-like protein [Apodospora peruviana]
MVPHAGFDTEQVKEKARKDLLYLLEGVRGKKNLVIEKNLAGPLGIIVKASTLRDYGVDKFFFLDGNTDNSQRNVVFIARSECAKHAHSIADHIRRLQRESQNPHEFHVFWVPRRTLLSDKVLEEAGVLGDTNVAELPLYFFPLEKDLLSLELDDAFRDLYLAKDPTAIFLLSKALMGIQQKHGLFPRIIGKGENAKRVAELLARMRQELLAGEDANETDKIGLTPSTTTESVILIDREVDFVTPLLTQLTYEGLIDEVFGIQNNQTNVDSTIVGAPTTPATSTAATAAAAAATSGGQTRKRTIQLDASDKLFEQLRDTNFAIVGNLLNKIAKRLQGDYESRHSTKTTAELTEFVKKLPGFQAEQQSLKIHTGLAEEIMKYTRTENFNKALEVQQNLAAGADPTSQFEAIEELIARDAPLPQVLRLLCIYSCISGGIKTKEFDHFRRLILQGYGYQHLLTLHSLEKLQMFLSRSSPLASMIPMTGSADATGTKTNYTYLRKQLRLIVDEVNEHDPNDVAYVYSGYAPLSIRLVQCVLQKQYLLSITRNNGVTSASASVAAGGGAQGWRGFDDAVKHARGPTFDEVQKGEDKAVKARALLSGNGEKKTVFVVFVGGISFTEIAALRFIAKKEEGRRNIVICTTSIISGNKMMEAAIEKESFEKDAPPARVAGASEYTIPPPVIPVILDPPPAEHVEVNGVEVEAVEVEADDAEVLEPEAVKDDEVVEDEPAETEVQTEAIDTEMAEPEVVDAEIDDNMVDAEHGIDDMVADAENDVVDPEHADDADAMVVDDEDKLAETEAVQTPDVKIDTVKPAEPAKERPRLITSSLSVTSEPSDVSSMAASRSSKATTPIDGDSPREHPTHTVRIQPTDTPRRRYSVRPKCIAAAESSRLNPYALHQEEYLMLRDHISHAQVTTYLNIRNVTREEAVGCAKDTRWFDVASVCFDWLVRRGYINFGCVEDSLSKRKTIVVIGAGMQLEGLISQYAKRFKEKGEQLPQVILLEGRNRVGGRVYSRPFASKPNERFTAEMGGMIITGFERGNPINILVRGQLGLPYRPLRPDTTLYDHNGKPLVEKLYNDCLDRLIEGNRDSAEAHKTIRQAEESTAAQPHSLPVSEQNIAPQVNLVPISSDRATGRIHTEPGTPGALRAAYKAKLMGWALKQGPVTKEPNATLGSVTDKVIEQLMNWHIANLEYSNAINYNQLSLQGWDIDAGNEWEGHHTMVIGGYQSFPTPLNIRQKSPGSNGPVTVECEDGYKVEADYVVSTIPLGVLKHPGSVKFEPELPSWKSDAIERLGFGVLNKVILVYKEAFWEEDRDIFGVLRNPLPPNRHSVEQKDYSSQRGRFFQWFNVTQTTGMPTLLALMAGDAGYDTEQTCNDDLVAEATFVLRNVFGSKVKEPLETVVTRWASDKFARGSYSSAGPDMKADDYDTMARSIGNLFFAGEHTSGTHPATVHGAYLSGLRAASEVLDAMLGPIEIPSPLVIPRESALSLSLKRKAAESEDPKKAREKAYEIALWNHITAKIGLRPLEPSKFSVNGYIFWSKAHYEDARKECMVGRRPGKAKPSATEVRAMCSKMWKEAAPEVRKPFEEQGKEQKKLYNQKMAEFKELAPDWDRKATELKAQYEKEHPNMPSREEPEAELEMLVKQSRGLRANARRGRRAATNDGQRWMAYLITMFGVGVDYGLGMHGLAYYLYVVVWLDAFCSTGLVCGLVGLFVQV